MESLARCLIFLVHFATHIFFDKGSRANSRSKMTFAFSGNLYSSAIKDLHRTDFMFFLHYQVCFWWIRIVAKEGIMSRQFVPPTPHLCESAGTCCIIGIPDLLDIRANLFELVDKRRDGEGIHGPLPGGRHG